MAWAGEKNVFLKKDKKRNTLFHGPNKPFICSEKKGKLLAIIFFQSLLF